MGLKDYFKKTKGFGVLSTADEKGKVDAAIYASPHVIDDTQIAFIMSDRLSHLNTTKNPYAVYLFRSDTAGYEGKRLYLKKVKETDDPKLIEKICQAEWPGPYCSASYLKGTFLVYFTVESELPLVVYDKKNK